MPFFDLELSVVADEADCATEGDCTIQPCLSRIRIPLKAYQLAEVQKVVAMERGPVVVQTPTGQRQVHTNIGILGDPTYTGKTLTVLALVAANPLSSIRECPRRRVLAQPGHGATLHMLDLEPTPPPPQPAIQTTLIVVPRGPVFTQWANTIKEHTTLNACILACVSQGMLASSKEPESYSVSNVVSTFPTFDCVLTHPGILKRLNVPQGFERIIVDEAHEALNVVPALKYRFLWLISSSYSQLIGRAFPSPNCLGHGLAHILRERDVLDLIVVRSSPAFIEAHSLPPVAIVEHNYLCRQAGAVHIPLQALLQAGDVVGAVKALGGSCMPETLISMNRVMAERLGQECGICMESIRSAGAIPVMLECSHVFCGLCVMPWIGRTLTSVEGGRSYSSCPTCRQQVNNGLNLAIVGEQANTPLALPSTLQPVGPMLAPQPLTLMPALTKEETVTKLIKEKPLGKWVVFARSHACMAALKRALLGAGVLYAELEGSGRQMNEALHNFQGRVIRVLLIGRAATGIRIDCATDAVLFNVTYPRNHAPALAGLKPSNGQPLIVHHVVEE